MTAALTEMLAAEAALQDARARLDRAVPCFVKGLRDQVGDDWPQEAVDVIVGLDYEVARRVLRTMPYRAYLRTDHWRAIRERALTAAHWRCQTCSSTDQLHVHHRTYERRGNERLEDLTVLCSDCHSAFHATRRLAHA